MTTPTLSRESFMHSLPLHENHSCQTSESALRLFCIGLQDWNNRKTQHKVLFLCDGFVAAAVVAS